MTRREYREAARALLEPRYGAREADGIALLIAGLERADFVMEPQVEINERLMEAIEKVAGGRPVQYVVGRAWFCGMELRVDERVLIPRPETEELVRWIVENHPDARRILDVGTGSGAIAIALKKALPEAQVTATDISRSALEVARANSLEQSALIDFIEIDTLAGWPAGDFDLVVSNPPYIPSCERAQMAAHVVDHEPGMALFVPDDDPLIFYRAIAARASGWLYFEVHENYARQVRELLDTEGFIDTETCDDLNGKPRMVRGRKR